MGRFTDPHPLTCSFFTPSFFCSMFGLCALPSTLSEPVLSAEEDSLFHRGHPVPSCAAFTGPAGPAFSFSACPWLFSPTPHQGETKPGFSHLGSPLPFNSSTTGSHSFNGAGNPFCRCHFPTLASKSQTGSHTGFSLFCSVSLPTFPHRGKAGLFSNLGCPGFARLAHNFPTRLQQGG